jgi:hypothetical protein
MTLFDGPEYSTILEETAKLYTPKALALLAKIKELLIADGLIVMGEPFDMSTDTYQWSLIVSRNPVVGKDNENIVDITIEISEEREYDGGEGYGISFALDIVEWGGRMLGGLAPYNYTSQCWVDSRDPLAVASRWSILGDSDVESIPDLITDGWEWNEDGYYKEEK